MFKVPEKYRVKAGLMASDKLYDKNNGVFIIESLKLKRPLMILASDGVGWEHVTVSLKDRTPTWEEMCIIKDMFWDEDDIVIQIHPKKSDYVNNHDYCLHLWRKAGTNDYCEMPDSILVGIK